jgi:hypothetical protein
LEHYVTAAAQFGGRHRDALANLKANGERRLAKSPAVARELNLCRSDAWVKANGVWLQGGAVDFHWDRLEVLCAFMAKGLAWHHWRATLGGLISLSTCIGRSLAASAPSMKDCCVGPPTPT